MKKQAWRLRTREQREKELIFVDYMLIYPVCNVLLYTVRLDNASDVVNTSEGWLAASSSSSSPPCVWRSACIYSHVLQIRKLRLREVKELPNITSLACGGDGIQGSCCVEKTTSRQSWEDNACLLSRIVPSPKQPRHCESP